MDAQVCSTIYNPHNDALILASGRDFADQDQNMASALIDRSSASSARPDSPGGMFASDMWSDAEAEAVIV